MNNQPSIQELQQENTFLRTLLDAAVAERQRVEQRLQKLKQEIDATYHRLRTEFELFKEAVHDPIELRRSLEEDYWCYYWRQRIAESFGRCGYGQQEAGVEERMLALFSSDKPYLDWYAVANHPVFCHLNDTVMMLRQLIVADRLAEEDCDILCHFGRQYVDGLESWINHPNSNNLEDHVHTIARWINIKISDFDCHQLRSEIIENLALIYEELGSAVFDLYGWNPLTYKALRPGLDLAKLQHNQTA